MITSRADVATDRPERYAKQLVSHLGRHTPPIEEGEGHRLVFGSGTCLVSPGTDTLVLVATAEDAEALAQVEDVVARHLIRFGEKDELAVTWAAA
ncbi:hypothetical protein F4553_007821 [Allocatelliglobosispora scoriae]|uniref:DUF2218 domain-containing protein n=1 Tax=Allocatelliglobosispora scoriae TaxID=643052 RepID=A0A841BZ24_9ACTN|nr:DUF2218 domain-containing protein [Allocatelliglobosispora scoriae]MBB5874387.1 hypothetical protein [Allocatelliglobosispora scoriae]